MDLIKDKKILIIEDEELFLESLLNFFKRKGLLVYGSLTISGAIDILKVNQFDLIITDYKLNDGLGTDILKLVSCPVIVITGYADIQEKTILDMGVSLILHKPVSKQQLFDKCLPFFQNTNIL